MFNHTGRRSLWPSAQTDNVARRRCTGHTFETLSDSSEFRGTLSPESMLKLERTARRKNGSEIQLAVLQNAHHGVLGALSTFFPSIAE